MAQRDLREERENRDLQVQNERSAQRADGVAPRQMRSSGGGVGLWITALALLFVIGPILLSAMPQTQLPTTSVVMLMGFGVVLLIVVILAVSLLLIFGLDLLSVDLP